MRRRVQRSVRAVTLVGLALLLAQASPPASAVGAPQAGERPLDLGALRWRPIGPAAAGGRVTAVLGRADDPETIYVGTAAGGILRSHNGGTTWTPVFTDAPVASIGALAIAPSNPRVIWAGTGEANPRNDVAFGNGVYKSEDGGDTWTHMGLPESRHVARILIHPRQSDVVYVAALGHLFGPNAERGVFRTMDGGRTWSKILFADEDTGASDIAMDPADPRILYAGLWHVRRQAWSITSGGAAGGLFKSVDGGDHWVKLTEGLPAGPTGRIGIGIAPSKPDVVYALVESTGGLLYRSDDRGLHWQMVNADHAINQRPFYFSKIVVSPANDQEVYSLSVSMQKSEDGGRSFKAVAGELHGDHHALWIDPGRPSRMLDGSDGGVGLSHDGGRSWAFLDNLSIGQFYRIAADARTPFYVCGGLQDNGLWCGPSNSRRTRGILNRDWYAIGGGDGMYAVPDPTDHNIVYADSQNGDLHRFDLRTGQARNIQPYPRFAWGWPLADLKFRFNWTSPLALSPHDPQTVYLGGNVLFRTTDGGQTWTAISPDLTRNDKSKQQSSGGPITAEAGPAEHYDTIYAVSESPTQKGLIWIGTDDGLVHVTRDGGATWNDVSGGLPASVAWARIGSITPSHFDAATAYITVDRHFLDDYAPYVYRTTDRGVTWTSIATGLPAPGYTHVVREDPKRPGLLYLGTELGIFVSFDHGGHWRGLRNNLPTTPVYDLFVNPRTDDLVAGTHGLSIWVLDDITPLRAVDAGQRIGQDGLLAPRPALRYRHRRDTGTQAADVFTGQDPPFGATLNFYLERPSASTANVTIRNAGGAVVRTMATSVHAGLNRTVWDLRHDPPKLSDRFVRTSGISMRGPLVVPGTYAVELSVSDRHFATELRVEGDPAVAASAADLEAQLRTLLSLRDAAIRVDGAVAQVEQVQAQLGRLEASLPPALRKGPIATGIDRVSARLRGLQEKLYASRLTRPLDRLRYPVQLRERLLTLAGWIDSADASPTRAELVEAGELLNELKALSGEFNGLASGEISNLNTLLKSRGLTPVDPGAPLSVK